MVRVTVGERSALAVLLRSALIMPNFRWLLEIDCPISSEKTKLGVAVNSLVRYVVLDLRHQPLREPFWTYVAGSCHCHKVMLYFNCGTEVFRVIFSTHWFGILGSWLRLSPPCDPPFTGGSHVLFRPGQVRF
ncbi:hypothetical protein M758_2G028100 [Ceratodon purpureus]|uniref:Uncharacterized protein n=1 Tax=Ceratodon purpureus TaxID=3225 RepID=A0A8T0ITH0_CERPU|nr:hypothetical protein KC19_2G028700 [Ceratodon purpureus]KAG0625100.1 hypothetical protein M758_2G028100 [Ceratodon purpureus]